MTRVGFIGLGVMGEAMCRNIVRSARYTVNVFDLSQTPVTRLAAEGASLCWRRSAKPDKPYRTQ